MSGIGFVRGDEEPVGMRVADAQDPHGGAVEDDGRGAAWNSAYTQMDMPHRGVSRRVELKPLPFDSRFAPHSHPSAL